MLQSDLNMITQMEMLETLSFSDSVGRTTRREAGLKKNKTRKQTTT